MIIWVAPYHTESGDKGIVGYFNRKPTDRELTDYFKKLMPDEFEGGCRYVYWDLEPLEDLEL